MGAVPDNVGAMESAGSQRQGDAVEPLSNRQGRSYEIQREIKQRTEAIFRERCHTLFKTADRTVLFFLPLQWVGAMALSVLQPGVDQTAGPCTAGVSFPVAALLGALVNGVPFAFARQGPGRPATRIALAVCMALFFGLLLCIAGDRSDVDPYLFVALALLAFYRQWPLLALMGVLTLVVQLAYRVIACGPPETGGASFFEQYLGLYTWVILEGCVLGLVCNRSMLMFRAGAAESAELERDRWAAHREVIERTRQLEASSQQYRDLLESTSAVPWELDTASGACTYIGAQVESQWGWPVERFRESGFMFSCVHSADGPQFAEALRNAVVSHDIAVEYRMRLASGAFANVRSFIRHVPVKQEGGRRIRGISIDITAQKKLEAELHQAQKLESVGRLAAGVAHEINTPVQFINDSCYFLKDAVAQSAEVLQSYREAIQGVAAGTLAVEQALEKVNTAEQLADITF